MSTSNLARIRDNQRRSRARRKEHLQDTEKRLRQLEREGVEVSTDIQKAARRVVEENIRLRSLLRLHGVTDVEIDEHLRGSVNSTQENAPVTQLLVPGHSISSERPEKPIRNADVLVPIRLHDILSPKVGAFDPAPHTVERQFLGPTQPGNPSIAYRVSNRNVENTGPPEDITPLLQPVTAQMTNGHHWKPIETSTPPLKVDNTTSCLLAANILAGMCCAKSAEEVSAELGCFPGTDCVVDNVKLFQIMDR
ncbi:hypothetical protein MMC32_006467 [Xylographa parallela]|nr:hypothetical protein [Xylographa parallela]